MRHLVHPARLALAPPHRPRGPTARALHARRAGGLRRRRHPHPAGRTGRRPLPAGRPRDGARVAACAGRRRRGRARRRVRPADARTGPRRPAPPARARGRAGCAAAQRLGRRCRPRPTGRALRPAVRHRRRKRPGRRPGVHALPQRRHAAAGAGHRPARRPRKRPAADRRAAPVPLGRHGADAGDVPARWIGSVQLCDAPRQDPGDAHIVEEAREGRLFPGEGSCRCGRSWGRCRRMWR